MLFCYYTHRLLLQELKRKECQISPVAILVQIEIKSIFNLEQTSSSMSTQTRFVSLS